MKTDVMPDYLEVKLTGNPNAADTSAVPEDLYTGTVIAQGTNMTAFPALTGRSIIFAKVHKIVVSSAESHYYVHKNAVIAVVE